MKKHAALLVIVGSALWGTDALFRRPLTGFLSPITIVLLEHCVLAVAVIPILIACRAGFRRLKGSDYTPLLFVALGGSVAATSLFTFAIKYGNPSVVVLLQKTQPLFTVLLARLILGERPARRFWPWFAAAIAGAYLISNPDWSSGRSLSPGHPVIVLCALGAAGALGKCHRVRPLSWYPAFRRRSLPRCAASWRSRRCWCSMDFNRNRSGRSRPACLLSPA